MNPNLRRVNYRISIVLVVLVLFGYGFAQFEMVQKSESNHFYNVLSKLNLNETQIEKQDSDTIESGDHFEEIEEFYLFSFVSLKLPKVALLNPTPSKSAYKKYLAYCCARDPPALATSPESII